MRFLFRLYFYKKLDYIKFWMYLIKNKKNNF